MFDIIMNKLNKFTGGYEMKALKLLVVGLLVASLAACSSTSEESEQGSTSGEGSTKIGLHYELSGEVADYGKAELKGSELAIQQANEAAGSTKYEGVVYDNKSDTSEAVILANQLVSDGVVGVVGPATSGASAATYQIFNDANVFVVSPSATANNQTLDTTGSVYDYVYRVCFEDSYQGAAMAQYAYDTLGARTAVVYSDSETDYAKGLSESFQTHFESLGGSVVSNESYIAGDTEFSSVLTKLSGTEFDVMYVPGYYNEAGLIIKQARALGLNQPVLGPDGFDSTELVNLATADALNDVYFTTAYTTVGASPELQAFIDAYKAEYNEDPNMFSALAYDATNLLIQAVEEAGSTDPEAVKAAMDNINFEGVTGTFSFDETHTPVKSVLVVELVDGVQSDAVSVSPTVE